MKCKIQLLSTVLLDQPLINIAAEKDIALDSMSFIRVDEINEAALLEEIEALCSLPVTAVFTSAHAVSAISKPVYIAKPDWKIYCTGHATKNALLDYFHVSAIKGRADDAAALAEVIIRNGVQEVVFFCGDKRMDTLSQMLWESQVSVHEVSVYETVETPQAVSKEYDGILFFSPSGVNSFFSVNNIKADTVLFAIGKTTAAAAEQRTANKIIVSETPSKEQLVLQAMQYFYKQAIEIQSGNDDK
jgi:uroporphyrinogen-III synthase